MRKNYKKTGLIKGNQVRKAVKREVDHKGAYNQVIHELDLQNINKNFLVHYTLLTKLEIDHRNIVEFKLELENGDVINIPVRKNDGLMNISMICGIMGKKFDDYRNDALAKKYVDGIYKFNDLEFKYVMLTQEKQIWVSRSFTYDILRWLNPYFMMQAILFYDELDKNKFSVNF